MTQTFTAEILDFQGAVYLRLTVQASSKNVAAIIARGRMQRMLGDGYTLGKIEKA